MSTYLSQWEEPREADHKVQREQRPTVNQRRDNEPVYITGRSIRQASPRNSVNLAEQSRDAVEQSTTTRQCPKSGSGNLRKLSLSDTALSFDVNHDGGWINTRATIVDGRRRGQSLYCGSSFVRSTRI